jgi:hypothetical protein
LPEKIIKINYGGKDEKNKKFVPVKGVKYRRLGGRKGVSRDKKTEIARCGNMTEFNRENYALELQM